jgi:HSP20 family protein
MWHILFLNIYLKFWLNFLQSYANLASHFQNLSHFVLKIAVGMPFELRQELNNLKILSAMKPYAFYPGSRFTTSPARFFASRYPMYYNTSQQSDTTKTPAANIRRENAAHIIELAIPGLGKEDIQIEVNNDELIVSAKEIKNETNSNFLRQEFNYNRFKKTFRLHKNANTDALQASFHQGLLTIVVPDREPESRKIEIL